MPAGNNSIFGAFTLGELRSGRLTGEWLHPDAIANYGWFGGGYAPPATLSIVDRIDFSNDLSTASVRGSLSAPTYSKAATGSSNFGWFGGGGSSSFTSVATVDRIDFSNDSATASVRGPLFSARHRFAATGNSNYGWFGAGISTPSQSVFATVDRIDFSNDSSTASFRSSLSAARYRLAATGNSNYGWFGGGFVNSVFLSTVDRIDFSNDFAIATIRGPLSLPYGILAATGNSNYGWFGGGNSPSVVLSTVNRIDFSNDLLTASVRGPLSAARSYLSATANSNYGWFGAGQGFSIVDRIDFSNDSATASVRGPLSLGRNQSTGATSGVLNIRRQKAGNFGWFGGGRFQFNPSTFATFSTVDRIDFFNDSATASIRGPLSRAVCVSSATGNSDFGWFGGGVELPGFITYSTVSRIDFSNDSSTATVRGSLNSARSSLSATGNSNYGWFGGGYVSGVNRINFLNDLFSATLRGSLNLARGTLGATGNSNFGWFGGGITAPNPSVVSTVERIDFSNDSPTATVRGPLNSVRFQIAATGNSNYGWFGGGYDSRVDRINFSNDSVIALQRGNLSVNPSYSSTTTRGFMGTAATSNTPIG